ncbi:uncharacterized protein LOC119732839 [Patiria miniata]|uniref:Helix-turn-helix domain-containing protein n=1 Tax=Patiria miniata TaxID=46514 RepID=A0A914AFT8_PATMI|nr:uncharacterized protein LOC119732839 [Patiria miniata]
MEQEQHGTIPFLDVKISRNLDGTLGHSVYRKPTHTDRYLHQRSFHHPSIKSSVNRILVQRAFEVCDQDNLKRELKHIQASLQWKGYKPNCITISKPDQWVSYTQGPSTVSPSVTLPYIGPASHHLQRILRQAGIKVYHSLATSSKAASTLTRTSRTPLPRRESTAFYVNAAKSTSAKPVGTFPLGSRNTEHMDVRYTWSETLTA